MQSYGSFYLVLVFNFILQFTEELFNYMQKNKTECALKIFNSSQKIKYPNYIMKAVKSDE